MGDPFLASRLRSFACAFAGLRYILSTQRNAWIHAVASLLVLALGFHLHLGHLEWCGLVVAIALVWMAESFNTALESLADASVPELNPLVGRAKDSAAAAVLIAAIAAAAIGSLILGPPLWSLLFG